MKKLLLGSLLCLASPLVLAQTPADSLLPEAIITAYGAAAGKSVAAAVDVVHASAFRNYGEATPLFALNALPGVRFEERAPGSYRINIRGSSQRSPFGVRNVKVYWNNLPFTEANGGTPLNLLDVSLYQQVEVLRGPAASYYGGGTGGVLSITSLPQQGFVSRAEAEVAAGTWGYNRLMAGYQHADSAQSWRLGITHVGSEGYREHSDFERQNIFWTGRHALTKRQRLETNLLLARADYSIPGGLTAEQFAENPRMSRPGSIERNASVHHRYALAGVGHVYEFSKALTHRGYLFGNTGFYDHPFNTDYKRDLSAGGGVRSIFEYQTALGQAALQLQAGGEYQYSLEVARNWGNRSGRPDTLNFDDEIRSQTALAFVQADLHFSSNWSLTAGLSMNWFENDIYRLWDARLDSSYRLVKTYTPVLAPRLGLLWDLSPQWQLWGQISRGFSPPSLDEVRTNEGSLNQDLEAEIGTNYEVGLRSTLLNGRLSASVTAYFLHLQQTITSYTSGEGSVVRFRNAGETRQAGLETQWKMQLVQSERWQLQSSLAAAWQHFRFSDYHKRETDLSGNAMPGVAPLTSSVALQAGFNSMLSLSVVHQYTDAMPLNDENTAYTDPYQLLSARLDWSFVRWKNAAVNLFVSGQNLLNERYSLGFDLNAFGQRYYQPAAERSWIVGLQLQPF